MEKAKTPVWYDQRQYAGGMFIVGLLAAYLMGSRALDTGSLQEYFVTFVILILAINRAIKTIRG